MPVDLMFILATAAFAFGLSLATYRWFAVYNGWPMGEWQSHRPGLPIAIGLFAVIFAFLFALARGGSAILVLPLVGTLCALTWTALLRVGAQSALLLAPAAVIALLIAWIAAVNSIGSSEMPPDARARTASPVVPRVIEIVPTQPNR